MSERKSFNKEKNGSYSITEHILGSHNLKLEIQFFSIGVSVALFYLLKITFRTFKY